MLEAHNSEHIDPATLGSMPSIVLRSEMLLLATSHQNYSHDVTFLTNIRGLPVLFPSPQLLSSMQSKARRLLEKVRKMGEREGCQNRKRQRWQRAL